MGKTPSLNVLSIESKMPANSTAGMGRREAVRRLLAGAGGALLIPGLAEAHPVHKHLSNSATLAAADAKAAAADWTPEFLDAHQNETLVALAERIVPGSNKAQVNRFIDLLLTVDTPDNQKQFVIALNAFEGEALSRFNKPYVELTEDQQNKILEVASTTKAGSGQGSEGAASNTPTSGAPAEPTQPNIRDYFENMKGWVSGAYYSSEIGMKELGWTGEVMFESFPGCQHPEGHH